MRPRQMPPQMPIGLQQRIDPRGVDGEQRIFYSGSLTENHWDPEFKDDFQKFNKGYITFVWQMFL